MRQRSAGPPPAIVAFVLPVYIDSHCHLCFPELAGDIDGVLARMAAAQVSGALNICVTLEEFPRVRALAEQHANIWCSVGVHPDYRAGDGHEGAPITEPTVEELVQRADHSKVVAIGETGLDYFRLKEPLDWQRERFRTHIRAARIVRKPLVVHTRAASADTLRLMREEGADRVGGVMHCFTESWAVAEAALELGFYISFSGIVTFKSASDLQAVARRVPLDRLLIETDAPYLAPVPHRGKTNEPGFVPHVAAKIGALRGVDPGLIATSSTENFRRLFNVLK